MKLSILIATIPERNKSFDVLCASLISQANGLADTVEILFERQTREELSIGAKRQKLLERATGEYIVFIDDDDTILHNYVSEILKAIETGPDSVGLNILYLHNGHYRGMCHHSRRFSKWHETEGKFYRGVTQFNPVRRVLALDAGFKDIRYGEDKDYSERLTPLCFTEIEIHSIIYIYNYSNKESHDEKYGLKK